MKALHSISLFSIFLLLNSCASITGFQTARTLDKGNIEISGSINTHGMFKKTLKGVGINQGASPTVEETHIRVTRLLEAGARYGITKNFDIGLRINSHLNMLLDAKVQVVGDQQSPFAMAIGGGIGSLEILTDEPPSFNFHLPLYTSYHPKEHLAFYCSPRYIGQFRSGTTYDLEEEVDYIHYVGSNMGVEITKGKMRIGIDAGYYRLLFEQAENVSEKVRLIQLGVGLKYTLNRKNEEKIYAWLY